MDKVWLIPRKCLNEVELLTSMTEKPSINTIVIKKKIKLKLLIVVTLVVQWFLHGSPTTALYSVDSCQWRRTVEQQPALLFNAFSCSH